MRRVLIVLLTLMMCLNVSVPALAADGFVIENGVLKEYKGSSTNIVIPNGVTAIAKEAFWENTNILSVAMPDSVVSIGDFAFYGCSSLKTLKLSQNLAEIGACAFDRCSALEAVTIPGTVKNIEYSVFTNCSSLTSVSFAEGVAMGGESMFQDCTKLTSVSIPGSMTEIGYEMFSGCTALQTVKIAEGVSSIEDLAFENCSALSNINFPASITKIGKQAFDNCDALTKITLPSQLSTLEAYAFRDCDGLESITIPGSLDTICFNAFNSCSALSKVIICEGVTTLESYAFANCMSLSSVSLPASITKLGAGVFLDCVYLDNIYYGGSEEQWAAISKGNKNSVITKTTVNYETEMPDYSAVNIYFTDVAADAYYYKPVQWAVAKAVTNGTSTTAFSPDMTCTNAHILTFMWRAAESPEPAISNPFSNLMGDEYYYKAALWAYERGMVNGTVFEADKACTRAMTVQYFWMQAGSPKVFVFMNFADVPADADYAAAVSWAVAEGITNGTSGTTFSPDDICTRAQIVTFLYRALVGE